MFVNRIYLQSNLMLMRAKFEFLSQHGKALLLCNNVTIWRHSPVSNPTFWRSLL